MATPEQTPDSPTSPQPPSPEEMRKNAELLDASVHHARRLLLALNTDAQEGRLLPGWSQEAKSWLFNLAAAGIVQNCNPGFPQGTFLGALVSSLNNQEGPAFELARAGCQVSEPLSGFDGTDLEIVETVRSVLQLERVDDCWEARVPLSMDRYSEEERAQVEELRGDVFHKDWNVPHLSYAAETAQDAYKGLIVAIREEAMRLRAAAEAAAAGGSDD